VNRRRRAQKKTLSFVERASAEQTPETGERSIGHEAPLAGDAAVSVIDCYLH